MDESDRVVCIVKKGSSKKEKNTVADCVKTTVHSVHGHFDRRNDRALQIATFITYPATFSSFSSTVTCFRCQMSFT